jgi:hypothetical protein
MSFILLRIACCILAMFSRASGSTGRPVSPVDVFFQGSARNTGVARYTARHTALALSIFVVTDSSRRRERERVIRVTDRWFRPLRSCLCAFRLLHLGSLLCGGATVDQQLECGKPCKVSIDISGT